MLNRVSPGGDEAILRYGDNDIAILRSGRFVRCAVSGAEVPIDQLRYWSVDLQEAYAGPAQALERWKELQSREPKAE